MKKISIVILFIVILLLSGCGNFRENLLAAPDEMEIPEGSLVAVCEKDDVVYKHIYQNDGIYQYFINDELQSEEVLDTVQEQAYLKGESMANYLNDEYGIDGCVIDDYDAPPIGLENVY